MEEREKHFELKSNKKLFINKDAAKIFKESLKDENDILESVFV